MEMLNTLNNRDWALIVWVLFLFGLTLYWKNSRRAFIELLKSFKEPFILGLFTSMLLYIGLLIFLLYIIGLWDSTLTKDTFVWGISAFLLFVRVNDVFRKEHYFRKLLINGLQLSIIVQFIVNFYVFDFIIELILMPLLFLLIGIKGVSDEQGKYKKAKKAVDVLLTIFGMFIIVYLTYNILTNSQSLLTLANLRSFNIVPLLTIGFFPYLYFVGLYLVYDIIFHQLDALLKNDKRLARFAKIKILSLCGLNLSKLNRFMKATPATKYLKLRDESDVVNLIRDFENPRPDANTIDLTKLD